MKKKKKQKTIIPEEVETFQADTLGEAGVVVPSRLTATLGKLLRPPLARFFMTSHPHSRGAL